jgi:hypothetical protein
MKLLKQAMAGLGTVVVIAVIAALVTPKTAHAIVATAVNVVNPSATPVPTSNVGPTNEPFYVRLCTNCADVPSSFTVPTMTTDGKTVTRLAIEHVSGICRSHGNGFVDLVFSGPLLENNLNAGSKLATLYVPAGTVVPTAGFGAFPNEQSFSQPVRFYADPDSNILVNVTVDPTGNQDLATDWCDVQIEGYLATQ